MPKIISEELVIGNALIEYDKEIISLEDLLMFDKILSNKLKKYNYYTKEITRTNIINFCDTYPFISIFDYDTNSIIVFPNKALMYKYFRIGLPKVVISSLTNIIDEMNYNKINKKILKT